jgi:signal transduction histidine kinase
LPSSIRAARDAQTQRERLASAEKMEALGLLAGGIAHDFNNLLAAIRGFSELHLDTHAPDDPAREDVVEICLAADRAAELVRQLLAFGRRQPVNAEPLDLAVVVASSLPLVERLVGEGIRVVVWASAGTPTVLADRLQLEQVLLNLAANARDAMPRGGLLGIETAPANLDRAFVAAHPGAGPGLHALLALSDTGSGMDEESRSRAFEPFFTTKARGRGTGLGLASVHGIVKEAGGTIDVESVPGAGSTFRIFLPAMAQRPEDYAGP